MEKISKKALQGLLNDSLRIAISTLELPKSSKKVEKLLDKSSKKIAAEFVNILKKQNRKAKKADESITYVEDVLKGKKNKKQKISEAVEAILQ